MTDPIAEAAAAQNDPTMLERANEKIHELEAKLEHMIHPDDAAPSSTEPVQEVAAAQVGESSPAPSSLPSLQPSEQSSESAPAQSASSVGSLEGLTAAGEREVAASEAGEPTGGPNTSDVSSSTSETSNVSEKPSSDPENSSSSSSDVSSKSTPSPEASPTSVSAASSELPNAASSPSADASPATESPQEPAAGTDEPAPSVSAAIREHLKTIRSHLRLMGFEQSTVKVIHGAMDEIERLL